MGFYIDVKQFGERTLREVELIYRKTFLEIGKRVVEKTPVDQGYARGGWQTTTGSPASISVERQGAAPALSELQGVVAQLKVNDRVFLSNLVPYIGVLEFGGYPLSPEGGAGKTTGGFSTQAPNGMVGVTIAEFDYIVADSADGTGFRG